ncbi:MAG: hypothetical protein JST18_01740 [Bacteroidetes bacterium]|nr:hypothetical protein [Bacteroidota bacterium]
MSIENYTLSRNVMLGFVVKDNLDRPFVALNNHHLNIEFNTDGAPDFGLSYKMGCFPFSGNGRLYIDLYFGDGITDYEVLRNAFHLELQPANFYHSAAIPDQNLNMIVLNDVTGEIKLSGVLKY